MKDIKNKITEQKNKLFEIIASFESYYESNNLEWDIKEISSSHQILGTLIITFKKLEYMEQSIDYFVENDLLENFLLELEEVVIIVDYYETVFIKKGA